MLVHELIENKKTIIDDSLKKYVDQISDGMKKILGYETFNSEFIKISQQKFVENENRKSIKAQEAILDPVAFAQKRLEKNRKTKEEKKRKRRENQDDDDLKLKSKKRNFKKKKKIEE